MNSTTCWEPTRWQSIDLAGHPCYVYAPDEPLERRCALIYLHDRSDDPSLAIPPSIARLVEEHGLATIVPWAPGAWWSDRIDPYFDPVLSAEALIVERGLAWIAEKWNLSPPHIGLLGLGMGGQGALRLAYKHPNTFPVVGAISPLIDFQHVMEEGDPALRRLYRDSEHARQDTATLHIHPLNWPRNQWFCCDPVDYATFDGVERLRTKLYSLGVPHVCETEIVSGEGVAYLERIAPDALQFLLERLDQERRRMD